MSQEKCNAMLVAVVLGLLLHCSTTLAATYTVGDSTGWAFGVAGWENGKSFQAGDTLVFKYGSGRHTVAVVDKSSYDSCSVPSNAQTYTSGNDQITLAQGANYFICGVPGHCQAGMKIAAIAA